MNLPEVGKAGGRSGDPTTSHSPAQRSNLKRCSGDGRREPSPSLPSIARSPDRPVAGPSSGAALGQTKKKEGDGRGGRYRSGILNSFFFFQNTDLIKIKIST